MREFWFNGESEHPDEGKHAMSYTTESCEQLKAASEAAAAAYNLEQAKRNKEIFDRYSSKWELKVGENCLVLLPSSFKKFCTWRGPYEVTKRVNTWNYETDCDGRKAIFHINMLRKYEKRTEIDQMILVVEDLLEDQDADFPVTADFSDNMRSLNIGKQLIESQNSQLLNCWKVFLTCYATKLDAQILSSMKSD
jgi:hypothetical protein